MTRWISTSEVLAMLGVSRALLSELMGLTREAALDPPWTHYGGTGRRARYRWASGDVDTWWKEICAWRQSKSAAKGGGGWVRGFCGGWSCYVEQGRYGHAAKKATWLYAFGTELPSLRWGHDPDQRSMGHDPDQRSMALVSWCGNHVSAGMIGRPRIGKAEASRTPPDFRAELIAMARSCTRDPPVIRPSKPDTKKAGDLAITGLAGRFGGGVKGSRTPDL